MDAGVKELFKLAGRFLVFGTQRFPSIEVDAYGMRKVEGQPLGIYLAMTPEYREAHPTMSIPIIDFDSEEDVAEGLKRLDSLFVGIRRSMECR